jgi:hypothetical protein
VIGAGLSEARIAAVRGHCCILDDRRLTRAERANLARQVLTDVLSASQQTNRALRPMGSTLGIPEDVEDPRNPESEIISFSVRNVGQPKW